MIDSDPEYLTGIELEYPGFKRLRKKDVPGAMYSGQLVTPFGISKPTDEQRIRLWAEYHELRGETPDDTIEKEPFCSDLELRWGQLLRALGMSSDTESLPSMSDSTLELNQWLDHNSAFGDIAFPSNIRIAGNPNYYVVHDVPVLRKSGKPVLETIGRKGNLVGARTCLAYVPIIEEGSGGIIFATGLETHKTDQGSYTADIPFSRDLEVLSHGRIYWPPYERTQLRDMLRLFYLATLSNTTAPADRKHVLLTKIAIDYRQVSEYIKTKKV